MPLTEPVARRSFVKKVTLKISQKWIENTCVGFTFLITFQDSDRSSCLEVFCKTGVLKRFSKFTGKPYVGVSFLRGQRPATLFKKRPQRRCCSVNFAKFIQISSFIEHLRWLLLLWDVKLVFLLAAQIGDYQIGDSCRLDIDAVFLI